MNFSYCHYYVKLQEGEPDKNITTRYKSYDERAKEYIEYLRGRKIDYIP